MNGSEKRAYRIPEILKAYGIGRTLLYKQIRDGKLKTKKIGRATLVTKDELDRWQKSLEERITGQRVQG